ncbi:putative helicase DEXDc superfamily protein [Acinetobacter phage Scuro]|nr:putative helicase DEXDc superfamily protein [Acinetobacter phage Scuro]
MIQLRGYQRQLKSDIIDAWDGGEKNVLGVLPTSGGKTATFSDIILTRDVPSCAVAHRQELVSQISTALARNGIRHNIIGPPKVVKLCVNLHMEEMGKSFFEPNAYHAVAGVDTLIRRVKELSHWTPKVKLWVQDEAHHVLRSNKWGKSIEMFPKANGLGVTATPTRADGRGLGRQWDGVFDAMVEGPSMRDLIDAGYMTDYRLFTPPSNYHRPSVIGTSGDFTREGMRAATKNSRIVGDVVAHYLRLAPGKLGVTFVPDLDTADEVAAQFNASGVAAAVVSSKTPDEERVSLLRKFKNREILQLVNVDLFGEGFDLPAIEVVSFARPTESLSLYIQQFGRVLRLMLDPGLYSIWESITPAQRKAYIAAGKKPHGIVIDHVGNADRHKLPDAVRIWTLESRSARGSGLPRDGVIPLWSCDECSRSNEKIYTVCIDCGTPRPEPKARSGPEFVDGDLIELSPETLARMRQEVAVIDMDKELYRAHLAQKHVPHIGQLSLVKKHVEKQQAQAELRKSLAWWGGLQRALGRPDSESYRRFYFSFGVDILSAQALGTKDALELKQRVDSHLSGVIKS